MREFYCNRSIRNLTTNLALDTELAQDACEGKRQVSASVGFSNLNNVKEHRDWHTVLLEVHGDGHKGAMVRRRPGVGCEVQRAFVLLR